MKNLIIKSIAILFLIFLLNFSATDANAWACSGGTIIQNNGWYLHSPAGCTCGSKGCSCTLQCAGGAIYDCYHYGGDYPGWSGSCSLCTSIVQSGACGSGGRCYYNGNTSCTASCSGGYYCNGVPITAAHGQTGVCGGGNVNYGCNNGSWYSQGTFCTLCATPVINTNSIGAYPGLGANLGWNAVTNATFYALRIHDESIGVAWNGTCNGANANAGNFCSNVGTSYSWTAIAGHTYSWWVHSCNGGTCSDSSGFQSVTAPSAPTATPTPTNTPTPTPTPTNTPTPTPVALPYFKVKDTSFYKIGNLTSNFPTTPTAYDGSDTVAGGYFNQGQAGMVIASGSTLSAGTGGTAVSGSAGSARNWTALNYSGGNPFTSTSFLNYVKAKKNTTAATYATLPQAGTGGTYSITDTTVTISGSAPTFRDYITIVMPTAASTLNLNIADLGKDGVTFIVSGDVNVNGNAGTFNSSNRPFAVIATGIIKFGDSLTEADGLYVGGSALNFGTGAVPLKIIGNVSSTTASTFNRDRAASSPSMFIVFDPRHYMSIADKVSTVKSSWTQLQ